MTSYVTGYKDEASNLKTSNVIICRLPAYADIAYVCDKCICVDCEWLAVTNEETRRRSYPRATCPPRMLINYLGPSGNVHSNIYLICIGSWKTDTEMFIHIQVNIYFWSDFSAVDMYVAPLMNFEVISVTGDQHKTDKVKEKNGLIYRPFCDK
jgi:hypothetical protein